MTMPISLFKIGDGLATVGKLVNNNIKETRVKNQIKAQEARNSQALKQEKKNHLSTKKEGRIADHLKRADQAGQLPEALELYNKRGLEVIDIALNGDATGSTLDTFQTKKDFDKLEKLHNGFKGRVQDALDLAKDSAKAEPEKWTTNNLFEDKQEPQSAKSNSATIKVFRPEE